MSDFDVFDDSDHLPRDHLLNELESIKGLLHSNGDNNDDDGDTTASSVDIPLLDDMVIGNLDANARLLNLNRIFEEESEEQEHATEPTHPLSAISPRADIPFPRFKLDTMLTDDEPEPAAPAKPALAPTNPTPSPTLLTPPPQKSSTAAPRVRADYSRDVLIQELVDEFVPQIEAALRERLSQLDHAALQQWKDRD